MDIRAAKSDDLDQILELFRDTIQHVNSQDYSPEQIEVWQHATDRKVWLNKIKEQSFFVALMSNQIVGFSSVDADGYVDFMYTHRDHQGEGIAKALLEAVEKRTLENKLDRIWASVSITAQPFFKKNGYNHYENEHKMISGVHFKNALMEKMLIQ
ncbi:GNAT family N-acetyltransferase [Ekhidna sp.]|uniref:GNAT family N-acetyltransferase n=1 Tax=Ekhidna sp. TaxID=2608089 RepID=UPI003298C1C9